MSSRNRNNWSTIRYLAVVVLLGSMLFALLAGSAKGQDTLKIDYPNQIQIIADSLYHTLYDTVQVYDTTNVESLTLRNVDFGYQKDNGKNSLSYQAETRGDSVLFEYFHRGLLIQKSLQYPKGGIVRDTLKDPPLETLQVHVKGYWEKWVEPFSELVNVAFLDSLTNKTDSTVALQDIPYLTATWTAPSSNLTDYIGYFDLSDAPQSWWDEVNTSDGTKLRVAKDDAAEGSTSATELAFDVQGFDDVAQEGHVWFKWTGTLPATGADDLRIYPAKSSAVSYAATDTYGSQAVWGSDIHAYHLEEQGNGTADEYKDASGGINLTGGNTQESTDWPTRVSTKFHDGQDFDGTDDAIAANSGDTISTSTVNRSISVWFNAPVSGQIDDSVIFGPFERYGVGNPAFRWASNDEIRFEIRQGNSTYSLLYAAASKNVWNHLHATYDGSTFRAYLNGSLVASEAISIDPDDSRIVIRSVWDEGGNGRRFEGLIDEARFIGDRTLSGDYIAHEYSNQNDPTAFWSNITLDNATTEQTISVSDTGSGADNTTVSASATINDTGQGIDSPSILASLGVQDSGQGADAVSSAIQAIVQDTGQGVESISNITISATVQDSGAGSDEPITQASIRVVDDGQGSELLSIAVDLAVNEQGAGADAINVLKEALKTVSDAGTGSDDITANVSLSVADQGSGVMTPTIQASIPVSDQGAGADAITVMKEILKTVSDSGSGSDGVSISADLTVSEIGQGQDSASINVALTVADQGSGIDSVSTIQEKLVQIADAGQGSDGVSVNVQLQLSEQGFASEAIGIQNTLTVLDQGQGVDVIAQFDSDIYIADIQFTFHQRQFEYSFKQRSIDYQLKQRSIEYSLTQQAFNYKFQQRSMEFAFVGQN